MFWQSWQNNAKTIQNYLYPDFLFLVYFFLMARLSYGVFAKLLLITPTSDLRFDSCNLYLNLFYL